MAVRTDNLGADGTGRFPYAEIDHTHGGKTYIVRVTAIPPYRDGSDQLNCHIDFHNITDGVGGRWANQLLDAKQGGEGRRGPLLRFFNTQINQGGFVPSPVFP